MIPDNTTRSVTIGDPRYTRANGWVGGELQQAASHLTDIERGAYELTSGGFSIWGYEMNADPVNRDNGYITWVGRGQEAWTLRNSGIGPNSRIGIGQRLIPEEPMAMVSPLVSLLCSSTNARFSIAECRTIGRMSILQTYPCHPSSLSTMSEYTRGLELARSVVIPPVTQPKTLSTDIPTRTKMPTTPFGRMRDMSGRWVLSVYEV